MLSMDLVVGRLSAYKGSVPDENIDEISKVMATAQALEAKCVCYLVCKLLLTLCLLIACPIRLEGTSLGRNLPILNLCILSRNKARMNAYPFFHIL